ncbi:MAG: hypothetical protein JXQ96_12550 [Cyclobacteriaceae bacterium]
MKKLLLSMFCVITFCSAQAQFYSGKYTCNPQMEDFDHIVVHQHPHHHQYGGDLTVKAFVEHGELWHSKAELLSDDKANEIIKKFGDNQEILSVYELEIELDGEDWEYFLLGYKDDNEKGSFIVVEEIFDIGDKTKAIEINTFKLNRIAHHHKL